MAYYDFLNIIFAPLLKIKPLYAIIIISGFVSLIITLITKYFTDQKMIKKLRDDMKENQKQLKEYKDNPQKLQGIQKKQFEIMGQQMRLSLKVNLITLIPFFIFIGWMGAVYAYQPIYPGETFNVIVYLEKENAGAINLSVPSGVSILDSPNKKVYNNQANWTLKGNEGGYTIEFQVDGETQAKDVLITNSANYKKADRTKRPFLGIFSPDEGYLPKNSQIQSIHINYKTLTVLPIGYKDWFGWLGTYFISSLIFTMILRKLMKVY